MALKTVFFLCAVVRTCCANTCEGEACYSARSEGSVLLQGAGRSNHLKGSANPVEYDPDVSPQANLMAAFDTKVTGSAYTDEELAVYKTHAMHSLSEILETESVSSVAEYWEDYMTGILEYQAPAVTQSMIDEINAAGVGWEAGKTAETELMTVSEFRTRLGTVLHEPTEEDEAVAALLHAGKSTLFADSFDPDEKWPFCKDVMAHQRDQGNCGSCWAMAAAGSIEMRLCIVTQGAFQTYISGGYITSCNPPKGSNGCGGGYTFAGYDLANRKGIPTGSNNIKPATGCVPYFGSGGFEDHWNSGSKAPPCPNSCSNKDYDIPLKSDVYWGTKKESIDSKKKSFAQQELSENGPLVMAYTVYQDFMSYKRGVYKHRSGGKQGGHAVSCTGWGRQDGKDYLQCTNSWGADWGENGRFKIVWGDCQMYYEAGWSSPEQPNLPDDSSPQTNPTTTRGDEDEPVTTTTTTKAPVEPGCCNEPCELDSDCNKGLFCCKNHNLCMDKLTKATIGPKCFKCKQR